MSETSSAAVALSSSLAAMAVLLLRRGIARLPHDVPNARSLHARPVPRAGGYAIWAGFLPVALLFAPPFPGELMGWLPAWLALALVSGIDDVREVRVAPRLGTHAVASLWSAAFLAHAVWPQAGTLLLAVAVVALALVLAWSANLYNFLDGNDGLAASMGAIGFGAYALATLATGESRSPSDPTPALVALVASLVPFLVVNLPRASMFMGDVGAVPLGFLAAFFGIAGVARGDWPAWFPVLVFLPFIADASITLVLRLARGERVWEGHRSHFYQRLHQLGAHHGGTLAIYVAAMLGSAATALACLRQDAAAGWWALAAWIAVVCMMFATIDYHWRKKTNIPAHPRP